MLGAKDHTEDKNPIKNKEELTILQIIYYTRCRNGKTNVETGRLDVETGRLGVETGRLEEVTWNTWCSNRKCICRNRTFRCRNKKTTHMKIEYEMNMAYENFLQK